MIVSRRCVLEVYAGVSVCGVGVCTTSVFGDRVPKSVGVVGRGNVVVGVCGRSAVVVGVCGAVAVYVRGCVGSSGCTSGNLTRCGCLLLCRG